MNDGTRWQVVFKSLFALTTLLMSDAGLCVNAQAAADRPHLLWITVEDMSPILGCYGDAQAITPNVDKLAQESVRYTHAFATAPVCSPARSCLITGCYAPSMGTHNMRSASSLSRDVRGFPALLRDIGYFTTNNEKTDYNTADADRLIRESWDESSSAAHWRNRPDAATPFFSVFNLMTTHQSRTMVWPTEKFVSEIQSQLLPNQIHYPATIGLPPYYPDTPVTRREWARLYDCVTVMDQQVGQILEQLNDDGLADDTIVFFFSDHGSGMPRHKRCLLDTGMQVPLLIRFPKKYAHLASGENGTTTNRLVSFVDFAPTVLSLLSIDTPRWMQGQAFLGDQVTSPRDAVFGHRDRVDEAFDTARSLRTSQYLYIRNFMPHLSYNQPTAWPDQGQLRQEFYQMAASGKMTDAQKKFAGPVRPVEELYDCNADPLNLRNLASSPQHAGQLQQMRDALRDHLAATGDFGFVPESFLQEFLGQATHAEFASDYAKEYRRIVAQKYAEAAFEVGTQDADRIKLLLDSKDPVIRYWGAVAARNLEKCPESMMQTLLQMMRTDEACIRVVASDAVAHHGGPESAVTTLAGLLDSSDLDVVLAAMRTLELLDANSAVLTPAVPATAVKRLSMRCDALLQADATAATFVQTAEQDLAMFISFSANAWLKRHNN